MSHTKRKCDNCQKEYMADNRNLKRGWGLCCSKKCAAKKREMSKPGYDPQRVELNNLRRRVWNEKDEIAPSVVGGSGVVTGYTSEGYRVMGGVTYDEFDEPVYDASLSFGEDDYGWDAHKDTFR